METGFDEEDLRVLFEAILNMYEHDRSSSKGEMAVVSPLILFRHTGTDSDLEQRKRQARLGCAPSYQLFDLVRVEKRPEVEYPRSCRDYTGSIRLDARPAGVDVGFSARLTARSPGIRCRKMQSYSAESERELFPLSWLTQYGYCPRRWA